jgi:hypothetical protein
MADEIGTAIAYANKGLNIFNPPGRPEGVVLCLQLPRDRVKPFEAHPGWFSLIRDYVTPRGEHVAIDSLAPFTLCAAVIPYDSYGINDQWSITMPENFKWFAGDDVVSEAWRTTARPLAPPPQPTKCPQHQMSPCEICGIGVDRGA